MEKILIELENLNVTRIEISPLAVEFLKALMPQIRERTTQEYLETVKTVIDDSLEGETIELFYVDGTIDLIDVRQKEERLDDGINKEADRGNTDSEGKIQE